MKPKLYKHKNNTDVAIEILDWECSPEKGIIEVEVNWYNIGNCHKPWAIGISEIIQISTKDLKDWEEYKYESL